MSKWDKCLHSGKFTQTGSEKNFSNPRTLPQTDDLKKSKWNKNS